MPINAIAMDAPTPADAAARNHATPPHTAHVCCVLLVVLVLC